MSYTTLALEREGHVAVLTLDRPDRMNAFDQAMRDELPRAWREIGEDPEIFCAVLTGRGDRAFCAGMDLKEPIPAPPPGGSLPRVRITALDCEMYKPVITAVNGVCAGGGLAFVADSDIVLCADTAYFTDARTSSGQVSIHGTLRLARKIPLETVMRLVLLGKHERLSAARAVQIGMASEMVPAPELMARARALAAAVSECSPNACFHTKRAIWKSLDHGLSTALEHGWETVTTFVRDYDDAREGAAAFVEKRKPRWVFRP